MSTIKLDWRDWVDETGRSDVVDVAEIGGPDTELEGVLAALCDRGGRATLGELAGATGLSPWEIAGIVNAEPLLAGLWAADYRNTEVRFVPGVAHVREMIG